MNEVLLTDEDTYLKSRGVNSRYAVLCSSNELMSAFVRETSDITRKAGGLSHFGKLQLYQHYFPDMQARPKFTGFENVSEPDAELRQRLRIYAKDIPRNIEFVESGRSFSECMSDTLAAIENPLIYFSGGLDSEFVLRWYLANGMSPNCVVINWIYNSRVVNEHDTVWAHKFLLKHPQLNCKHVYINLNTLWNDVSDVSRSIGRSSPQHIAYVKSIELLAREHKYDTHVMAGEIRYALVRN